MIVQRHILNTQRGGILIELLLSVALAAVIMPFLFRYQQNALERAENIALTRQMGEIQTALERYIVDNRENLLMTVGRTISRVNMSDLAIYGLSESTLDASDKYQLRILKSNEGASGATLQGVVVMSTDGVPPLRTREIVSMGGANMGFIEGSRAYGAFGTWHADAVDLGVNLTDAIVEKTAVNRDNALYLWRVPSDNASDATMMGGLNLGGHDIENVQFLNVSNAQFQEVMTSGVIAADSIVFKNRTTIDKTFNADTSTVSGALSSDSRTMEVAGTFLMSDLGKFSSFTADDLWVTNLTLAGLSIPDTEKVPILKVNQSIDMTSGRIDAMYATVGFTGSITPRLQVSDRIEDSVNSAYFWDAKSKTANFLDAIFVTLNDMAARLAVRSDGRDTVSRQLFVATATNKNATVSQYLNAISEMQTRVRAKYRRLNLE